MRPFILLPILACLILIVAHRARSFSSGAPEESCDSLTVIHTHVGSPAPGAECGPPCLTALCLETCRQFRQLRLIGSSADSFIYSCNETYHLQLTTTAPGDNSLNGYMVAPREDTGTPLDRNVSYVGSWENGTDIKLLCNKSAVTHTGPVTTKTVNITWKAPMYGLTNVAFWFVLVPSITFYYLPVKSLTATPNPEACSCPPGQCQWQNDAVFSCVEPDNSLCGPGEVFSATECQCEACALTCQNGGTLNEATCTCDCADGYSGNTCGSTCSRVCQNEGTLDGGTCMCSCVGGFSGANCETCTLTCQNGGTLNEATCTCNCADGYSGDTCGTCSRVCQNEGTLDEGTCMCSCVGGFSGDNCEIIACGHLDPPRNGRVSTNAGTFGDVARYFCNEGYVFVPTETTCQADGQWSWPVPICERVSCGQPDSPSNGHVNTSAGTSFGDVARYSCDTGYTLNGPAETTCQADGQWNESVPTCLQCPPVCAHQYCSKRANRAKVCSLPGFGSCTGVCKLTSCKACYYNESPREIPSGCQQSCNGLTEKHLEKCLNRWGACVRKKYKILYSEDQVKRTGLFKCFEYPC